jgi:polyribonucleotide 5'-hydroxyl-kinase
MARLDKDVDARASGIIINTCGWVDGEGYNLILHCIQEFNVDVVLVMDQDKLYSSLSSHLAAKGDNVTVVMLPRSGGVVTRDRDTRLRCRKGKFRDYFYGVSKSRNPLSPVRQDKRLSALRLLRAGGIMLTEGMRSVGDTTTVDTTTLTRITPSQDLLNFI